MSAIKFCIVALGFDPGALTTLLTEPEKMEKRGLGCSKLGGERGWADEEEGADEPEGAELGPGDNDELGEIKEEGRGRASGPTCLVWTADRFPPFTATLSHSPPSGSDEEASVAAAVVEA